MKEKIKFELALGVLFFVAISILGYYTIIMGRKIFEPEEAFSMTVIFKNVEGLNLKDKVKVNGVISGSVTSIDLKDTYVVVGLRIYRKFTLHENYAIRIKTEAALGGKHVSIIPGTPTDDEGKTYAVVENLENLTGEFDDPLGTISRIVEENRKNIQVTFNNLREITDKINSGKGTIGKLLNIDDVHSEIGEMVKDIRETIEDAREQAPITSFIRAALTVF
jgi:phospholipid/cholesterol/gamma-HCH transport system substrate-binding protein